MGWTHDRDTRGEHEGFVVAYVPRDWLPTPSAAALGSGRPVALVEYVPGSRGPLRELGVHPLDRDYVIRGFGEVGAACECGWRSPRRNAFGVPGVEWSPNVVERPAQLEEKLERLWAAHVEQECAR
jgi:hypothetical protein